MKMKIYYLKWKGIVKLSLFSAAMVISSAVFGQAPTDGLKLHYAFNRQIAGVIPDSSGNSFDGTLVGTGISIGKADGRDALIFDAAGTSYVDMNGGATGMSTGNLIASLDTAYTIETYVYFDATADLNQNGLWIWAFANSTVLASDANGGMFFEPRRGRAAIGLKHWEGELGVNGGQFPKGRWVHLAYTQSGTTGTNGILYYDGNVVGAGQITLLPANLGGVTPYNFIGRACYANDWWVKSAKISDYRIYNRALSKAEVEASAFPAELITQYAALNFDTQFDGLTQVINDITLPAAVGGINVTWTSSDTKTITNDGKVTRPALLDAAVTLTATFTYTDNGITYSRPKTFTATVLSLTTPPDVLARWDFDCSNIATVNGEVQVKDISGFEYVATLKNSSAIRTIGTSAPLHVLDLGTTNGYMDLGTEIGKMIYKLGNKYTIGAYFYTDPTYTRMNNWGNCLWVFSNNTVQASTGNGTMFCSLRYQGEVLTSGGYSTEFGPKTNPMTSPVLDGNWHHIAYVQDGDTGRIFVDGAQLVKSECKLFPSVALPLAGREGTLYNTIGKPAYTNDSYLGQSLVYGFEVFSKSLTASDLNDEFGLANVPGNLAALNIAMMENPNVGSAVLDNEVANFVMPDLTGVTSNLTLPTQGPIDPTVAIQWNSGLPSVIATNGTVKRPDYADIKVGLTALFSKACDAKSLNYTATVLRDPAVVFNNDLVLKYDFSPARISGTTVTDAAEKGFTGTLMKGARVDTIGKTCSPMYVLTLPSDSGYFDMGTEIGKVVYGLKDYSISVFYYYSDSTKKNLNTNGNFLYTFSNSDNSAIDRNGYMFGRASVGIHSISPGRWDDGAESTIDQPAPTESVWHHFVFTQKDTVASVYIDGVRVTWDSTFYNLPATVINKINKTGTLYNWMGRANFAGDSYFGPAKLADLEMYKKALTEAEVTTTYNNKIGGLNAASICDLAPLAKEVANSLKIYGTQGFIVIENPVSKAKIYVFDSMGRSIPVSQNTNVIAVKRGLYIVKMGKNTKKVYVR